MASNSSRCNQQYGRFIIEEIGFNTDGTLKALAVTFEDYCVHVGTTMVGDFRFNSSVPLPQSFPSTMGWSPWPSPLSPPPSPFQSPAPPAAASSRTRTPVLVTGLMLNSQPGDPIAFGQQITFSLLLTDSPLIRRAQAEPPASF